MRHLPNGLVVVVVGAAEDGTEPAGVVEGTAEAGKVGVANESVPGREGSE